MLYVLNDNLMKFHNHIEIILFLDFTTHLKKKILYIRRVLTTKQTVVAKIKCIYLLSYHNNYSSFN